MFKKTPLIFEKNKNTDKYMDIPAPDTPSLNLKKYITSNMVRKNLPSIPTISEPEVVRHFSNLADKNHHVDKDFYPLGSCTMKYNPKINDKIASDSYFLNAHPDQSSSTFQGHLELLYKLEKIYGNNWNYFINSIRNNWSDIYFIWDTPELPIIRDYLKNIRANMRRLI